MSDFREEVVSVLVQHTRNVGNRIDAKALLDELVTIHQKHSVPDECVWPEPDLNNAALQTGCGGKSMFVTPYCMCCGGKVTIAAAKEESK